LVAEQEGIRTNCFPFNGPGRENGHISGLRELANQGPA
jgi:hypothetical protein